MIEEGIIEQGVKEMYEEGYRILSEMVSILSPMHILSDTITSNIHFC